MTLPFFIYEKSFTLIRSVGRQDDVVIHSSGLKTLPGPIEQVVASDPL